MNRQMLAWMMIVLSVTAVRHTVAEDWPNWRGVNRDAISRETQLLKQWPEGGPKLLWSAHGMGEGYSGPAIVGKTMYTMGDKEVGSA